MLQRGYQRCPETLPGDCPLHTNAQLRSTSTTAKAVSSHAMSTSCEDFIITTCQELDHSKSRYNVVPKYGFYCIVSQCMISYSGSTSWTIMSCRVMSYHIISYHIHVTMGALDQYSRWNDASLHASPCSVSFLCILKHIINAVFAVGSGSWDSNCVFSDTVIFRCRQLRTNSVNSWVWSPAECGDQTQAMDDAELI